MLLGIAQSPLYSPPERAKRIQGIFEKLDAQINPYTMLRIDREGNVQQVTLCVTSIMEDETCIVCIMADDETEYYFTDLRVISMSDVPLTVIWYTDIVECDLWFFENPVNIYDWESAQEKKDYLSRLLVTYSGHHQILFTGLGDSINIIRNFFQWLATKNTQKN